MRIAMVGTGGFAREHLSFLSQEEGVDVVAHLSRSRARGQAAAQRWGGEAYTAIGDLLEAQWPDAVWIAVPPGAHGDVEEKLIQWGIPFFVEKPLSADRETAQRIGEALEKRPLIAAVGYHWRAMDTMPAVREALAERPARMVLAAWHGSTPPPLWWRKQTQSGGQIVEQATHLFDIARHLVGEAQVVSASAERHERPEFPELDVATTSSALLRFENGANGIFSATCLLPAEASPEVYVKLVCDGRLITITREGVTFDEGREQRQQRIGELPLAREDRAFLEAVRRNDASLLYCSYEDALKTHRLCFDVLDVAGYVA